MRFRHDHQDNTSGTSNYNATMHLIARLAACVIACSTDNEKDVGTVFPAMSPKPCVNKAKSTEIMALYHTCAIPRNKLTGQTCLVYLM